MKKHGLTKEEIRYLRNSQKILKSHGIFVTNKDINEGLLGLLASTMVAGAPGALLYWWLSDDAKEAMDDVKSSMTDVLDAAEDLQSSMENLYGEVESDSVKNAMIDAGNKAVAAIKEVMDAQFTEVTAEMDKVAKDEGREGEKIEKGEERVEASEEVGGGAPMAYAVMAAAITKVITEAFKDK